MNEYPAIDPGIQGRSSSPSAGTRLLGCRSCYLGQRDFNRGAVAQGVEQLEIRLAGPASQHNAGVDAAKAETVRDCVFDLHLTGFGPHNIKAFR